MNSNLVAHFAGSCEWPIVNTNSSHSASAEPARQDSGGGNLFGERKEEAKVISGVGEMSKNVKS